MAFSWTRKPQRGSTLLAAAPALRTALSVVNPTSVDWKPARLTKAPAGASVRCFLAPPCSASWPICRSHAAFVRPVWNGLPQILKSLGTNSPGARATRKRCLRRGRVSIIGKEQTLFLPPSTISATATAAAAGVATVHSTRRNAKGDGRSTRLCRRGRKCLAPWAGKREVLQLGVVSPNRRKFRQATCATFLALIGSNPPLGIAFAHLLRVPG
jgi:hypothetical protein